MGTHTGGASMSVPRQRRPKHARRHNVGEALLLTMRQLLLTPQRRQLLLLLLLLPPLQLLRRHLHGGSMLGMSGWSSEYSSLAHSRSPAEHNDS